MSNVRGGSPHRISNAHPIGHLDFGRTRRLTFCNTGVLRPFYVTPTHLEGVPIQLLGSVRPSTRSALVSGLRSSGVVGTVTTGSRVVCVGFRSGRGLYPCLFVDGVFSVFTGCHAPLYLLMSSGLSMSITVSSYAHLSGVVSRLHRCTRMLMRSHVAVISIINGVR